VTRKHLKFDANIDIMIGTSFVDIKTSNHEAELDPVSEEYIVLLRHSRLRSTFESVSSPRIDESLYFFINYSHSGAGI